MARQLIRYNAIRVADSLDDQLSAATIAALESSAITQEDLQEGVLSQLKRILVGDDAGAWDDDFLAGGLRPIKQLDQGLKAIDRIIIRPRRTQAKANIAVPTGQTYVVLSAANAQTPTPGISLQPSSEGAVAAQLATGQFGANRTTAPVEDGVPILVDVVDAATEEQINDLVKNQPIRGILQVKDTASDGSAFDDALNQAQLSFVTTDPATFSLVAADPGSIGGKTIHYAFAQRQRLSTIPTVGFLIDGVGFVDGAASVDVTRQHAYDFGPLVAVTAGKPHQTNLAQDGAEVDWRVAGVNALRLLRDDSAAGSLLEATVARFHLNNAQPAELQKGLRVDTADGSVEVGVTPGKIARLAGSLSIEASGGSLTLSGAGGELAFADSRVVSPMAFSSPGNSSFYGMLAGQASLIAAINKAATVGGVRVRLGIREYTGGHVNAGTNVPGGGFFDFTFNGLVFFDETTVPSTRNVFVFVNGVLERNGNSTTPYDVRLGINPGAGDLIFSSKISSGDVIVAVGLV